MPALPAWAISLLIKYALPFILRELVKSGLLSEAGAVAAQFGIDFNQFLKTIKTSHAPGDFPQPPPQEIAQHNFTTGQNLEPKP